MKPGEVMINLEKESGEGKNRGWPKGKRRYPKGVGAPKQPLSGYVHFLNERRESVRSKNPEITFSELSKKLAAEWSALSETDKNKYNEMAKRDKYRYDKEFSDYQQTEAYKQYLESQRAGEAAVKKKKKTSSSSSARKRPSFDESDQEKDEPPQFPVTGPSSSSVVGCDIPIFTEEFLNHNKSREVELRQLRKQTTEFEEQNAVLGKHIDNMKSAIGKLEVDTVQQRQNNASLQQHLDSLRQLIVSAFRGLTLPGSGEPLTLETADQFVANLHGIVSENSSQHDVLITTVRDIVARMDYGKIST